MLIGDKGQSGGRRWEVPGFAIVAFSGSPNVSRWGGGRITGIRIFDQSQGHPLELHKELAMFNQRILSLDHPY